MIVQAFKAVFWSFFGVRKRVDYESDAQSLKPQHVVVAGLIAALTFVLALIGLVKWVTS